MVEYIILGLNVMCQSCYVIHPFPIMQMKERKEKKLAANLEETRSHMSKATTSRYVHYVMHPST